MINQKPCKYNPTIEASDKRQKTKKPAQQKSKKIEPNNYSSKGIIRSIQNTNKSAKQT